MKKKKSTKRKKTTKKIVHPIPQSTLIPPWLADIGLTPPEAPEQKGEMPKGEIEKKSSAPAPQEDNRERGVEELDTLLLQFYQSEMWIAYKAFTDKQIQSAEHGLRVVDVIKEPAFASRNQGKIEAINELRNYIESVIREREEKSAAQRL